MSTSSSTIAPGNSTIFSSSTTDSKYSTQLTIIVAIGCGSAIAIVALVVWNKRRYHTAIKPHEDRGVRAVVNPLYLVNSNGGFRDPPAHTHLDGSGQGGPYPADDTSNIAASYSVLNQDIEGTPLYSETPFFEKSIRFPTADGWARDQQPSPAPPEYAHVGTPACSAGPSQQEIIAGYMMVGLPLVTGDVQGYMDVSKMVHDPKSTATAGGYMETDSSDVSSESAAIPSVRDHVPALLAAPCNLRSEDAVTGPVAGTYAYGDGGNGAVPYALPDIQAAPVSSTAGSHAGIGYLEVAAVDEL